MARVGIKDLFAWEVTQDNDEGITFGEPFRVAKAIEVTINPQSQEASLYADDAMVEYVSAVTGYDISLNVDDLTTEVKGKLLGYEKDADGVVIEHNELDSKEHAVAFRAKRSDGNYEYRVLYKVRFAPTEDRYKTQGDSVEFQTPTITGKAMAVTGGLFGANVIDKETTESVISAWFEKPHLPKEKATTGRTSGATDQ